VDDFKCSTAGSVTLQACSANDVKLVRGRKCCKPAFVTFEFAKFSETNPTMPERCCRALSVMRPFWERLREVREVRSFMFFTPTSVIPPPHSSNVCSFLKSAFQLTKENMVSLLGLQYRTLLGTQNRKLLTSAQREVGLEKGEERPPEKLDTKTNKNAFL
jgi:hypothetical protein